MVLQSNLLPLFGVIKDILFHCDEYYFGCCMLDTQCYNAHFHAYEVTSTSEYILCTQSDLADHYVLSYYNLSTSSSQYIPVKYHLNEHI